MNSRPRIEHFVIKAVYSTMPSFPSRFRIVCLSVAVIIASGCGGGVHQNVFAPSSTAGQKRTGLVDIDLTDARITISPVVISEKLQYLVGPMIIVPTPFSDEITIDDPLRIDISIQVDRGTVLLDFDKATIAAPDDGRTWKPTSAVLQTIHHSVVGRSERTFAKVEGPTKVVERGHPYRFIVSYETSRADLKSFLFKLGTAKINGKSVTFDPVLFTRTTRSAPK